MAELQKEVQYVTIQEFVEGWGTTWKRCNEAYYIRQQPDEASVEEKKKALVDKNGDIKVFEAFAVQKLEDGTFEIISGNTRAKALWEMFQSKTYPNPSGEKPPTLPLTDDNFKPIPYRLFDDILTPEEAIEFQTSTNDFTKKHNPYDIGIMLLKLRPRYEEEVKKNNPKMSDKTIDGQVTSILCTFFKRTKQNISQLETAVKFGSPMMHEFLKKERIITDNAVIILRYLRKKLNLDAKDVVPYEEQDKILTELWNRALTNAEEKGNTTEKITIYRSVVDNYLESLDKAAEAGKDLSNGTDIDTPPLTTQTSTGTGTGTGTGAGTSTGKGKIEYTSEDIIEAARNIGNLTLTFKSDKLVNQDNAKQVKDLGLSLIETAQTVAPFINTNVSAKWLNMSLYEIAQDIVDNIEPIIKEAQVDPKNLGKLGKSLGGVLGAFNPFGKKEFGDTADIQENTNYTTVTVEEIEVPEDTATPPPLAVELETNENYVVGTY